MLLLYPPPDCRKRHRHLYLHSIMLLLYRREIGICIEKYSIYIPLCFYFIQTKAHRRKEQKKFTFHYASTLSSQQYPSVIRTVNLHSIMLLLYLAQLLAFFHIGNHLHSIMLLLYPNVNAFNRCTAFIYIPLCFYFIAEPFITIYRF